MRHLLLSTALLIPGSGIRSQTVTNISCTNPLAEQVMKGLYDPLDHAASDPISDHERILCELRWLISTDSLLDDLRTLEGFHTRNSHSDTSSVDHGIGAARRWVHSRFQRIADQNEGRLIPAYLQFDWLDPDSNVCGSGFGWRNVFAVLPGTDPASSGVVLVEAHLDSRCAGNCDIDCPAPGMDDNGSGCALVIELARVLSRYTFRHTLVFLLNTGEEQGLAGAEAMAAWCEEQGIAIKSVQNNDIVGGVLCGNTSSPPGCAPPGSVDSLELRLFSSGSISAPHRGFARTIKLWYEEKLQDQVAVPMDLQVINKEDRDGRGGDHIPFREHGFRNMRFTSANEHGNANVDDTTYTDHQHTSGDVLGADTDGDLLPDSFYVDLNYLQRNTLINGMAMTLSALGPDPPAFTVLDEPTGLRVAIDPVAGAMAYRVGVRHGSTTTTFESLYRTADTAFAIPGLEASTFYYVSVATVDSAGITSPFSREYSAQNDADVPAGVVDELPFGLECYGVGLLEAEAPGASVELSAPMPDPFQERTRFSITVDPAFQGHEAYLLVRDAMGRSIARVPLRLQPGTTAINYTHRAGGGTFLCSLVIDGRTMASQRMVVLR